MTGSTDEQRFSDLLREWSTARRGATQEQLDAWVSALDEMTREEADLRGAGRWVRGAADVFGILGISRAEVRHTRFIAWLMDPAARHGLGPRFLELILTRTFPGEEFPSLDRATPVCEVVRGECRVDIVVWAPELTLVVEAKVDADEGPAQCDYQYDQFCGEVGSRFIFLSPRGRAPRTVTGEAREAFRSLSFAAVRDDLRAALAASQPVIGRGAAEDYLRTLEREFPWPI